MCMDMDKSMDKGAKVDCLLVGPVGVKRGYHKLFHMLHGNLVKTVMRGTGNVQHQGIHFVHLTCRS